jgi:hypothetical protein
MVRLLKTREVPELVIVEPVADIVTVPPVGAKVTPELLVSVPATVKLFDGWEDGVPAMTRLENVGVPDIDHPVPDIVMVPAFGVKVPVTSKRPVTVADSVTALMVPLIFKPPYVVFVIFGLEALLYSTVLPVTVNAFDPTRVSGVPEPVRDKVSESIFKFCESFTVIEVILTFEEVDKVVAPVFAETCTIPRSEFVALPVRV